MDFLLGLKLAVTQPVIVDIPPPTLAKTAKPWPPGSDHRGTGRRE